MADLVPYQAESIDEVAKAIQEVSKLGIVAVGAGEKLGAAVSEVSGGLATNTVALILGDWVSHMRIRRIADFSARTHEHLKRRGIKPPYAQLSPSLAIPLFEAAQDESRSDLSDLWARLLADALDPARGHCRLSYIETVKNFDPQDAAVLKELANGRSYDQEAYVAISAFAKVSADEVEISCDNLIKLSCLTKSKIGLPAVHGFTLTPLGKGIIKAAND